MKNFRIVFMGTPDFAVASLDAIVKAGYQVVGVITAPDKQAGRGRKIQSSAVKRYALENGLEVFQPVNLKNEEFLNTLKVLNADLQVVVAFRMLPKAVWDMPKFGTFNLHASLLPAYRGAAPIHWAIINGETETGVTTFFIDEKIDTGELILQKKTQIEKNETVGELHDRLMQLGSELVVQTVSIIQAGKVVTKIQSDREQKMAPKLFKETCRINWHQPVELVYNHIRGLNPFPTAWTILKNQEKEMLVKIFDVRFEKNNLNETPGSILIKDKLIFVACLDGYIIIESIQLEGKKRIASRDLLNGFNFSENAELF